MNNMCKLRHGCSSKYAGGLQWKDVHTWLSNGRSRTWCELRYFGGFSDKFYTA